MALECCMIDWCHNETHSSLTMGNLLSTIRDGTLPINVHRDWMRRKCRFFREIICTKLNRFDRFSHRLSDMRWSLIQFAKFKKLFKPDIVLAFYTFDTGGFCAFFQSTFLKGKKKVPQKLFRNSSNRYLKTNGS